ncbi:hypothetical protein IWX50DRAFT_614262 [Phyllosticta citricarpa]|uniref:Uncharacterized protein n=1 Tax=Phyllosticta citricarpa TaxID=55181 RepID=A0ABR1MHN8_9PEZI
MSRRTKRTGETQRGFQMTGTAASRRKGNNNAVGVKWIDPEKQKRASDDATDEHWKSEISKVKKAIASGGRHEAFWAITMTGGGSSRKRSRWQPFVPPTRRGEWTAINASWPRRRWGVGIARSDRESVWFGLVLLASRACVFGLQIARHGPAPCTPLDGRGSESGRVEVETRGRVDNDRATSAAAPLALLVVFFFTPRQRRCRQQQRHHDSRWAGVPAVCAWIVGLGLGLGLGCSDAAVQWWHMRWVG